MRIFILFLCIALSSITAFSQKGKFNPGFYISQKGDTINGLIALNFKSAESFFNFKSQTEETNFKPISLDTCKMVSVGKESFVSWFGPRGMTYIDKFEFTIVNPDSTIIARIPLRQLYQGKRISLYYFRDIMDHFFIGKGGIIQELAVKFRNVTDFEKLQFMYQRNPPTYFSIPVYRDQIRDLIADKLSRAKNDLVESTEFDKRSLMKLFKKLDAGY